MSIFRLSPAAVWLQVAAATAVPLLAALLARAQGARITVREAIASYGLGGDFGSSRFDQWIDRVGASLLPSPYSLSLGNMFRRKGRLTLTLLVLVIAGVMFMVVMSLISSTNLTLDNDINRRGYDLRLGFIGDQRAEQVINMAEEVEGVAYAEAWYARNATILRAGERLQDSAGLGAQLTGIPVGSEMQRPLIVDGRWLQPGDDRALVVSQDTADENGLVVGDVIRLDLATWARRNGWSWAPTKSSTAADFATEAIYAPQEAVAAATSQVNRASLLYVATTSRRRHRSDQSSRAARAV
jgi:putative ABC transport system permease protein